MKFTKVRKWGVRIKTPKGVWINVSNEGYDTKREAEKVLELALKVSNDAYIDKRK